MNLFVASTEARARAVIQTLGLDPECWMPFGMGQALKGHRFDKIVVLWPHSNSDVIAARDWQWLEEELTLKLPPGECVKIL